MDSWARMTKSLLRAHYGIPLIAAALAFLASLGIAPLSAAAPPSSAPACASVTGTYIDVEGATGTFEGCFTGQRLTMEPGYLGVAGDLSMNLIDPSGRHFATLEHPTTLPIRNLAVAGGDVKLTVAPSRVIVAGLQAYLDPMDIELAATVVAEAAASPPNLAACPQNGGYPDLRDPTFG